MAAQRWLRLPCCFHLSLTAGVPSGVESPLLHIGRLWNPDMWIVESPVLFIDPSDTETSRGYRFLEFYRSICVAVQL